MSTAERAETSVSLREIETILVSLEDLDLEALDPAQRAEIEGVITEAVRTSVDKRERVAWRLFDLGQRADVKRAAAASHRKKADELETSAAAFDAQASRLKDYVLRVMAELPKPKKGVRTLEGTTATFKAKAVPDAVEITDEAAVPAEYKTVTVKMPSDLWEMMKLSMSDSVTDAGWALVRAEQAISKTLVKEALQRPPAKCEECNGTGVYDRIEHSEIPCSVCRGDGEIQAHVPGARLLIDRLRLEVS